MAENEVQLTASQVQLLTAIVEASRSMQEEFFVLHAGAEVFLRHRGLPEPNYPVYGPDLAALENLGFLTVMHYDSRGNYMNCFDISPLGLAVYAQIHRDSEEPADSIEEEMRRFVETQAFRAAHPAAYDRWLAAANLLWDVERAARPSDIGHRCREALMEFAASLCAATGVEAEGGKPDTVKRLKAVIASRRESLGAKTTAFLDALLAYWGTLSDLAQRLEHEAAREGEPVGWEDARRVVFQTLVVMYEVDRALVASGN